MASTSGYDPPTLRYRFFSGAECIWKREFTLAFNCHLVFRKRFTCDSAIFAGEMRVTASDFYRILINGQFVGEGPARSERGEAYVDQYNAVDLPISPGENVIVVMALNKQLAEHGQPPKHGGFALSLDAHEADGSTLTLRTGRDWKVREADWYLKPAPRRFFPVGFNEWVDFRKAPQDLLDVAFDDSNWKAADIVNDAHLAQCRPRPIPSYYYNHIFPKRLLRRGHVSSLDGVMGVPLQMLGLRIGPSASFRTWVHCEEAVDAIAFLGSDNRASVWINGECGWKQGEPDHGFRHHLSDYEAAWYPGMFHGHGARMEPNSNHFDQARCQLKAGWNELEIQMDFVDKAYGFEIAFLDQAERILPLSCSATQRLDEPHTWQWRPNDQTAWQPVEVGPEDWRPYLEPTHLALWDTRQIDENPADIDAITRVSDETETLTLHPGEFIELELEAYAIGYLKISLEGPPNAVVDFLVSEYNDPSADRISPMHIGLWLAERVILSGAPDHYAAFERRAGRHIYICVRRADGPVEISDVLVRNLRYGAERRSEFVTTDPVLNWMWNAGNLTHELSTFDLCEDCPTREMAQWSGDSFLRTHLLACLWGDLRLSAKAIREFADDQHPNRWGRAMVPAGYGDSIVDYALLLPVWAWTHYWITGDQQLLAQTFQGVRNLFHHAASLEDQRGYLIPEERHRNQVYLDMRLAGVVRNLPNVAGLQAYYVHSLEHGAKIAGLLKQKALAEQWRAKAAKLRAMINSDFWAVDQSLYMHGENADGELSTSTSAGTNYIMLWADIPDPERAEAMLNRLFPHPDEEDESLWPHGEGVYMKHFMADALLKRGRVREALTGWRGFYGSMMHQLETIPEAWDRSWADELPKGHDVTPTGNDPKQKRNAVRSLVHPFGAGPIWHFFTYICGIQAAEPGYQSIKWAPMPADLNELEAQFPLPGREEFAEFRMEPNRQGGRSLTLIRPKDIAVEIDRRWLNAKDTIQLI